LDRELAGWCRHRHDIGEIEHAAGIALTEQRDLVALPSFEEKLLGRAAGIGQKKTATRFGKGSIRSSQSIENGCTYSPKCAAITRFSLSMCATEAADSDESLSASTLI
jgi:hypothetical protein